MMTKEQMVQIVEDLAHKASVITSTDIAYSGEGRAPKFHRVLQICNVAGSITKEITIHVHADRKSIERNVLSSIRDLLITAESDKAYKKGSSVSSEEMSPDVLQAAFMAYYCRLREVDKGLGANGLAHSCSMFQQEFKHFYQVCRAMGEVKL